MKEAEEIVVTILNVIDNNVMPEATIISIIKQVQIEAYNQALDDAVENVELKETSDSKEFNEMPSMSNDMGDIYVIDKQSILKLKK